MVPERDALNCIRILTRVLPFIYEKDELEGWQDKFFWAARRRRRAEVLFDETNTQDETVPTSPIAGGEFEAAPPLMEELIDTLIDLLFCSGFTLPLSISSKAKVTFAIWQSGVGCNTPVGTTKEFESNKIETLRLLLAITSKAVFMPASSLSLMHI